MILTIGDYIIEDWVLHAFDSYEYSWYRIINSKSYLKSLNEDLDQLKPVWNNPYIIIDVFVKEVYFIIKPVNLPFYSGNLFYDLDSETFPSDGDFSKIKDKIDLILEKIVKLKSFL